MDMRNNIKEIEDQVRKLIGTKESVSSDFDDEASSIKSSISAWTDSFDDRGSSSERELVQLFTNFIKVLETELKEDEEETDEDIDEVKELENRIKARLKERADRVEKGAATAATTETKTPGTPGGGASQAGGDQEPSSAGVASEASKEMTNVTEEFSLSEDFNEDREEEEEYRRPVEETLAQKLLRKDDLDLKADLLGYSRLGDGHILVEDIPFVLRCCSANPTISGSNALRRSLIEKYGTSIPLKNFVDILVDEQMKTRSTEDIICIFESLDASGRGVLSKKLLKTILMSRGERFTEEEWATFTKEADPDHTGYIDYKDFVRRMDRNANIINREKRRAYTIGLRKEDRNRKLKEKMRAEQEAKRKLDEDIARARRRATEVKEEPEEGGASSEATPVQENV